MATARYECDTHLCIEPSVYFNEKSGRHYCKGCFGKFWFCTGCKKQLEEGEPIFSDRMGRGCYCADCHQQTKWSDATPAAALCGCGSKVVWLLDDDSTLCNVCFSQHGGTARRIELIDGKRQAMDPRITREPAKPIKGDIAVSWDGESAAKIFKETGTEKTEGTTYTNKHGGKQSRIETGFMYIPPVPLDRVSRILAVGAAKYGVNNWHKIPQKKHLEHALKHLNEFKAGDTSEDHLGNATCRLLFSMDPNLVVEEIGEEDAEFAEERENTT